MTPQIQSPFSELSSYILREDNPTLPPPIVGVAETESVTKREYLYFHTEIIPTLPKTVKVVRDTQARTELLDRVGGPEKGWKKGVTAKESEKEVAEVTQPRKASITSDGKGGAGQLLAACMAVRLEALESRVYDDPEKSA